MQKFGRNFKQNTSLVDTKKSAYISNLKDGDIRIINLGGTEECGKNMTIIEHKNSILIINSGAQFSSASMPGVDFIIPNIKYLEENKQKIRGMIFTSSGLEYSGAFPFINEILGFPRVYARHFTNTLVQKRCDNRNIPCKNDFIPIEENIFLNIGDFKVRFTSNEKSTHDSMYVSIETDQGDITYMSDTKLEKNNPKIESLTKNASTKTLCLIAESLSSELGTNDFDLSDVKDKLAKVFSNTKNKIFIATFANNIYHIIKIIELARELNKKIILDSKSIEENILSAQEVGLLGDITDILLKPEDKNKYKNSEIILMVTGEEGRETDTLVKILETDYKDIKVEDGDTVIIATHPIIHNQRAAQNLKDGLSRAGANIVHYKYTDILITPSGSGEDLSKIHKSLNPKFFIPISGCHYMLRVHADIERRLGTPENHIIIPDNGMIIEIRDDGQRISNTREKIDTEISVVDGNKIGKLHNVVLKDREILGAQGVFFIISLIDMRAHKLKKAPDLATRGFVFLKESQELLIGARDISKNIIEEYLYKNLHVEVDDIKELLQFQISKYLMTKTAKQPVVIPIIIRI